MKSSILKKITLVILFFVSLPVCGVNKPDAYQQRIVYSQIKALATIEKVVVTDWELGNQTKKVWFKTIKSFNETTPNEFTGYCMSFKNKWWEHREPQEGGYIYHYPQKGTIVLVTVESDNSYINSFKVLNKGEQKQVLEKTWEQLKVSPCEVRIEN